MIKDRWQQKTPFFSGAGEHLKRCIGAVVALHGWPIEYNEQQPLSGQVVSCGQRFGLPFFGRASDRLVCRGALIPDRRHSLADFCARQPAAGLLIFAVNHHAN
jgi:hypothetical protein